MNKDILKTLIVISVILFTINNKISWADMQKKKIVKMHENFEFIGQIEKITALSNGETITRKRWQVDIIIIKILSKTNSDIVKDSEKVVILVHSIIKTFGKEKELLIGKKFRFSYKDEFKKIYSKTFEVSDID